MNFLVRFTLLVLLWTNGYGTMAQDLSGFWLGVSYPNDPQLEIYNYTASLTQSGSLINGTSQTANPNVPFGGVGAVKGQFVGGGLAVKESDLAGSRNTPSLCYWDLSLTYDAATESLKGTYANIQNPPYCDKTGGGRMELYRIRLKSGATYCRNARITLDVSGVGIRWYDSPQKGRLLSSGNRYATSLPQSTTLYVTQTIYSVESPPVPIAVNVVDDCPNESIFLPSAFSPNGDAKNDVFSIQFPFPSLLVSQFTVFNRWGGVVFSREGFTVSSGETLWDGAGTNGNQMYSYLLSLKLRSGEDHVIRRTVMVFR